MRIVKIIITTLFLTIPPHIVKCNVVYNKSDSLTYESYIDYILPFENEPINELVIKTAKFFIDKPYVASTLDRNLEESLIINLREFDCTTFVENCIVLPKVVKSGDMSFSNYCNTLAAMRYRNGIIDGYTSRLHYSCDWIYENEQRKEFKDISLDLGGKTISKKIDYMSTNPWHYTNLKNNSINIEKIKSIENKISQRDNYNVISVNTISSMEKNILDGDIVLFATGFNGLDYSHMGIAYKTNGILKFIHASSSAKKIIVENKSLNDYCLKSRNCNGITVLRLN